MNQIAGDIEVEVGSGTALNGWRAVIAWVYRRLRYYLRYYFLQKKIKQVNLRANFTSRRCDVSSLSYSRNSLAYSHCSSFGTICRMYNSKSSHNLLLNLQWQAGQRLGRLSSMCNTLGCLIWEIGSTESRLRKTLVGKCESQVSGVYRGSKSLRGFHKASTKVFGRDSVDDGGEV